MIIEPCKNPTSNRYGRLLKSAACLFARWGFDKTSMEDIAREAGVSKGAVYLEFSSKDALFQAVVYQELERYTEDWLDRFKNDPGEWSFARMIQHSIAAINANPFIKALMTRDRRIYGSFLQRNPDLMALVVSMRSELFGRLQQVGAIRDDLPAPVIAYLLSVIGYGMVAGAEVIPEAHRVSFEAAIGALGLLLDHGLSPPGTSDRRAARDFMMKMVEQMQTTLRDRPPAR
ncbi:MAG: TetR/AcrR family transcriptional regulator [Desulfobacterales bacterium]